MIGAPVLPPKRVAFLKIALQSVKKHSPASIFHSKEYGNLKKLKEHGVEITKILLAACIAFALSTTAVGQTIETGIAPKYQALVNRDASGFKSCGIRVLVVQQRAYAYDFHDFSLVAYDTSGVIKAGKQTIGKDAFDKNDKSQLHFAGSGPDRFWVAASLREAIVSAKNIQPSNTPGFVLSAAELGATLGTLMAMMECEPIHFVSHYPDETVDSVVSFSGNLTLDDKAAISTCLMSIGQRAMAR